MLLGRLLLHNNVMHLLSERVITGTLLELIQSHDIFTKLNTNILFRDFFLF